MSSLPVDTTDRTDHEARLAAELERLSEASHAMVLRHQHELSTMKQSYVDELARMREALEVSVRDNARFEADARSEQLTADTARLGRPVGREDWLECDAAHQPAGRLHMRLLDLERAQRVRGPQSRKARARRKRAAPPGRLPDGEAPGDTVDDFEIGWLTRRPQRREARRSEEEYKDDKQKLDQERDAGLLRLAKLEEQSAFKVARR